MNKVKYILQQFVELLILWCIGGSIYMGIELLYRGYTHWTMGVVGGFCFVIIGLLNECFFEWADSFIAQMIFGGVVITTLELFAGIVLNIWLGLGIWDYSHVPFNFMGQICLSYSLAWVGLSAVAIVLDDVIRWKLFKEEKPHYDWR